MKFTRRAALAACALAACARPLRDGRRANATLWFSYGGRVRQTLLELVDRFHAAQSDYAIDAVYQGDYFESLAKLRTALAAGVAPTMSHVVGEVVPYLAGAGALEPLDAYPGAHALGLTPALAQAGTYVGGAARPLVAIPFNRSTPILYANRALLDAHGLALPEDWDALRRAAIALTDRAANGIRYGYQVPIGWWFWVAMMAEAGGELVDAAGRVTLGGDAGVRALAFWQTLVHEDHAMRPPPGRDYDAWQATHQAFLAGHAALIASSTAFVTYFDETASFPVVAAPMPRDRRRAVPTGGTFFVLLRAAPEREKHAAWAFVRWMCEPAQSAYWTSRTGYLPIHPDAVERLERDGFYARHPNARVALAQLPDVQPWPWLPQLFRIQRDAVEPRLEDAVLTNRDARAALADARDELEQG